MFAHQTFNTKMGNCEQGVVINCSILGYIMRVNVLKMAFLKDRNPPAGLPE